MASADQRGVARARTRRVALQAGAQIRTRAMVTGWANHHTVQVTSPEGRQQITARTIILATGARERPRTARLIPGMTTAYPRSEAPAALATFGRLTLRVPIRTRTRVARIVGRGRVEAVELEALETGARTTVACDTVVFTGDWIPDHELARAANLEIDPHTLGPLTDTTQATTTPDVYAIGNLTHPVDTADVAALDGRAVARHILEHIRASEAPRAGGPRVLAGANLNWITPGILSPGAAPPRGRFLAWPTASIHLPTVTVAQNGETVRRQVLPWPASPGRVYRIPSSLVDLTNLGANPITVDIRPTPRRSRLSIATGPRQHGGLPPLSRRRRSP